jgi:hypothetical protein
MSYNTVCNNSIKFTRNQAMFDDHSGIHTESDSSGQAAQTTVACSFQKEHERKSNKRISRLKQLEDGITTLAAHMDAAMYRWLEMVREFDAGNGWTGDGLKSCAHWLNWKCGLSLGAARERVRVAHALPLLPKTRASFKQGRLSFSKVRAITRVATPKNEEVLLNIAFHGTAWHVEQAVSAWRRELRLQALQVENRRHAIRELRWFWDDDGSLVIKGRLTPEQGAIFQQAMEATMQQLFDEQKDVPAGTSAEDQLGDILPRPHPIASRRADAVVRMSEHCLSGKSASNAGNFVINLHTDIETLKVAGSGAESTMENAGEGAGKVPAETSRRIACDAGLIHWLDNKGKPHKVETLGIGRKSRTVPPAIRRALQLRDKSCQFPGCTCSRFVDAHHIHHWADGGETNIDNLVLLCRSHHRLVHEGGFQLNRMPGGGFQFINPQGKEVPAAAKTRSSGNVFVLEEENTNSGILIDRKTCIPNWHGGGMDMDVVIEGLLRRQETNSE